MKKILSVILCAAMVLAACAAPAEEGFASTPGFAAHGDGGVCQRHRRCRRQAHRP